MSKEIIAPANASALQNPKAIPRMPRMAAAPVCQSASFIRMMGGIKLSTSSNQAVLSACEPLSTVASRATVLAR
jgi:hypothetical protein